MFRCQGIRGDRKIRQGSGDRRCYAGHSREGRATVIEAKVLREGTVTVVDYRCHAGRADTPYPEQHRSYSLSLVRRGSFGYCCGGDSHELVPGAVMIGRPGVEYVCAHDHHDRGDECLSFRYAPALLEEMDNASERWRPGALPPVAPVRVLGGLADAAVDGRTDVGLDEIGLLIATRCLALSIGEPFRPERCTPADRRRAVEVALWIDEQAPNAGIDLDRLAALAGLSAFHFLRLFSRVVGVTPHQYVVRARLHRAARLLTDGDLPVTHVAYESGFQDLSHFVRTFQRAAGMSPGRFRRLAHRHRKNLQDRPSLGRHDEASHRRR